MLKIRLRRMGSRHKPFYRVVVSDSRRVPRASAIEEVGYYDPRKTPATLSMNVERVDYWMRHGAKPSGTVSRLMTKARNDVAATAAAEAETAEAAAKETEAAEAEATEATEATAEAEAATDEAEADEAAADEAADGGEAAAQDGESATDESAEAESKEAESA